MTRSAQVIIALLIAMITLGVTIVIHKAMPDNPEDHKIVWGILTAGGIILLLGWAAKTWARNNKKSLKVKAPNAGKGKGSGKFLKVLLAWALIIGIVWAVYQRPEQARSAVQTVQAWGSYLSSGPPQRESSSNPGNDGVDINLDTKWTPWFEPVRNNRPLMWICTGPIWVQYISDGRAVTVKDGPGVDIVTPQGRPVRFRSRANGPVKVTVYYR